MVAVRWAVVVWRVMWIVYARLGGAVQALPGAVRPADGAAGPGGAGAAGTDEQVGQGVHRGVHAVGGLGRLVGYPRALLGLQAVEDPDVVDAGLLVQGDHGLGAQPLADLGVDAEQRGDRDA